MASINDALSMAEQAEAEAAEAEAQAAAARARAEELRTQKAARDAADEVAAAAGNADDIDDFAEAPDDAAVVADQPRRRRASGQRVAVVAVASLLLCALLAASGFMLWQGHQASERQAQEAEFAAAARQGVVNLMSLDFNNGDADMQAADRQHHRSVPRRLREEQERLPDGHEGLQGGDQGRGQGHRPSNP